MGLLPKLNGELRSTIVRSILLKELSGGIFRESEKLPPNDVLAEQLGVSRTVIRDALSALEREGFVTRTRGIGTAINRRVMNAKTRMDLETEFMTLVADAGYTPKHDHSAMYLVTADELAAKRLEIAPGDEMVACERSILADGKPIIFAIDHVPRRLFKIDQLEGIDWRRSIFDIIDSYCDTCVEMDLTNIHAVLAEGKVKEILQLKENVALVYFDEVGYDMQSRPILWSKEYYLDTMFDLVLMRKKITGYQF